MNRIKLGVRLESLGMPLRKALFAASKMEVNGVQFDAVGDLSPQNLSQTGRRELRHLLKSHNLELGALGCPLRRPLEAEQDLQPRLDHLRKVLELSYDMGPRFIIVEPGKLPTFEEPETPGPDNTPLPGLFTMPLAGVPFDLTGGIDLSGTAAEIVKQRRSRVFAEVMRDLSSHCDRTGTRLALQTGLDSGVDLNAFLQSFDSGGLAVNLDPANLLLNGFDPYETIRVLGKQIIHVHAHDGRISKASKLAQEVPVGHGDIDWMYFLALLEEIEYQGYLTVEREMGDNRLADVIGSIQFLRRFVL